MVTHATRLVSGQNDAIMEILPESEYFRDVVSHFKPAVGGATSTPETEDGHVWLPADAALKWTAKATSEDDERLQSHAVAFREHPRELIDPHAAGKGDSGEDAFSSFPSTFSRRSPGAS